MGMDHKTPRLTAFDSRSLAVRSVDYCRSIERGPTQERITRNLFDVAGRLAKQWDPRLWFLQQDDQLAPANLSTVYSLSAATLRTDSVDAGMQIDLPGLAGEGLRAWDGRGTQREVVYDDLLRPVVVLEQGAGQPRRCVERLKYGYPGQGSGDHNQYRQLIRHDDPAGSVLLESFSLTAQNLVQSRRFVLDAVVPDWPEPEADRETLLEPGEGARSTWCLGPHDDVLEQIDARGNRQRQRLTRDGRLRENHLLLNGQDAWQPLVRDIRYNAEGQIEQETAGNGVQTTLKYSPDDGRLMERHARRTDQVLQDLFYTYDPMGNVLSIEDKALPVRYFANQRVEPASRFRYDSLYQVTEATGWEAGAANQGPESVGRVDPAAVSNYRQTYRYDECGNLLELIHVGVQDHGRRMKTARYSNRCLPYRSGVPPTEEEIAAAFDARGNCLELDVGRFLAWDLRNQLSSVTPIERALGIDDSEVYVCDGNGLRVRKRRTLHTGARTLVAEVHYLPTLELRTDTGTGEVLQVITAQGGLNSVRVLHWESTPPSGGNDLYRYSFTDHLGSIGLELAQDGRIISRESFYPFGETAYLDETEVSYKTVRYSGKERDATGLYYYGFRYYAPWLQRWINPDPAGAVDGLNLYRMVRNNPTVLFDANGLAPQKGDKNKLSVSRLRESFESSVATQLPGALGTRTLPAPVALWNTSPLRQITNQLQQVSVNQAASRAIPSLVKNTPAAPVPDMSSGANPVHAEGKMSVGSHSLTLTKGKVVVMRGDDRSPTEIHKAGGFFPRDNRGAAIKREFRDALVTKKFNTLANEHVRSPVAGYVSTGMDEDSGGYGDTRNYLYRMEIPGLKERSVDDQTLGLNSTFTFTPKGRLDARLLMSDATLDQSEFVAMIPPMTVEVTFITPIPSAYIVSFRKRGSSTWEAFH
ncbi:RHS repeat-associated core domain-containing protein [Pseudomonas hefeiensis]|uniref:RHS repeat-associated core domain-containing protein n=1 Tax=Pseudomonas hefeiensis TaxID=2738125 RepID=A0ABY9GDM9_9PSED|nr:MULTISPECIES: RHS repeat-associated core domain-containing protein [unclassified Pseudomonas]WLH13746.1 RHS repeat-associated core domain-containing protein [Pseudomonas sp. FP205]WLH96799.1 RHS repeat-associated core domain-containing protein [Pseudomonas sp. FP53]WLI41075.1 RHS repeat-associated core domain-containing protein [Pseudomonas sp. FP821]